MGLKRMREIVQVMAREDHQLEITFDDGRKAVVDVKPLMVRDIFRPLSDDSFFRLVEIDHKFGGVSWPNGADICIDWLEAEIARQTHKVHFA
jgi:Protein of unknown function (DUF2442)